MSQVECMVYRNSIHSTRRNTTLDSNRLHRYQKAVIQIIVITLVITVLNVSSSSAVNVWRNYDEAEQARAAGYHQTAIDKYKISLKLFLEENDTTNVALMYNKMAESQLALTFYDDAVSSWELEAIYWSKAGKTQETIAANRKADWIRSRFELFVKARDDEQANTLFHNAKYEPKTGAYIGAYAENDKMVHDSKDGNPHYITEFPNMTGKKHAMYLLYTTWGINFFESYSGHIQRAKDAGVGLQVALQPVNGLDEVMDGEYIRSLAKQANAAGIPIFMRFANEMNGEWVDWYDEPAVYIEKFRLVSNVFKQEAPNVVMVWAPSYFPPDNIEAYYPGDEYVDWVGVSMYQTYNGALDPLKLGVDRSSYIEKFENIYNLYAKKKPVFISEGGVSYSHPTAELSDKTDWAVYQMKQLYANLPMLYPGVKGVFWFDTTKSESGRLNSYTLSGNDKVLTAYKKAVSNPFYLSTVGDQSPVTYKPLGQTVAPRKLELSAYIRTVEPLLAKVTYTIAGKTVATVTKAPWTFSYDFATHKGSTVDLKVTAYSSNGKAISDKTVTVKVSDIEPGTLLATPTASKVIVDGKEVSFEAYNINNSNYFKLRDLAMAVNGSVKSFDVGWDAEKNAINLLSGKAYTVAGGELTVTLKPTSRWAKLAKSSMYLDGKLVQFVAYDIEGSNYFKLRDIASLIDFNVTWNGTMNTVGLDTGTEYQE